MAVAAILLAAGGVRVGGVDVGLAPWADDSTLIEYEIGQLRDGGVDVIEVVVAAGAEELIATVAGNDVEAIVVGAAADEAAALRTGASAVPRDTEKAVIVRVEEPRPSSVIRALLEAHQGVGAVARPRCGGVAGTPVVVGYDVLAAVRNIRPGVTLDELVGRFEVIEVPFESDVVTLRVERRTDVARARVALEGRVKGEE